VQDLLKRGATPGQAAGILPIRRGELISQVKYQQKYGKKRNKQEKICVSQDQHVKNKVGKQIEFRGEEYASITALAETFEKNAECVRRALKKGLTVEQALGFELYKTKTSVTFEDELYPSKKSVALANGLSATSLYGLPAGKNLEQAVDEKLHKRPSLGRKNPVFYRNNPEEGAAKGFIYLFEINHPDIKPDEGKIFYKVGITSDVEKRQKQLRYVSSVWSLEATKLEASVAEKEIKDKFQNNLTKKFSPAQLDGKDEIFEITENQANKIKILIAIDLSEQKATETIKKWISDFNRRSYSR
jgi:hypothetical protein